MSSPPPTFEQYEPISNPSIGRKERREDVQTSGTATSTAVNTAQLPYAGDTAEAQLVSLLLRNEDLQRDLDKARKGEPLNADDKTRLITDVDAYEKLMSAIEKFDPDYVGTVFDFPGEIETKIQKRVNSDFGTPGQADFWAQMKFLDMLTRNKYFGASLSTNEKTSYAETTITPGDTSETALANLKRRADTVRAGIQRNVRGLMEGGYRPAQINAQLGTYLPELNPRWLSPSNERILSEYASREDFDPAVYAGMLIEFGDANGIRLDQEAAMASANSILEQREAGQTTFGGGAIYKDLTKPKDDGEDDGAPVVSGDGGGNIDGLPTDLGWGETLGSAAINFVPSVIDEASGIVDAVLSPIDTATSVAQLGGGLLSMVGIGDFDQGTARALGQYYANKYGSMEGFKRELAENPASILADVAVVFTGGAGAATKLGIPAKLASRVQRMGPKAVRAGEIAATAAKNIDPITALTNIVAKGVPAAVRGTGQVAGRVASGTFGASTGAGGDAVREAAKVGFDRSVAGAPTPAANAFLDAMRNPGENVDNIVQLARDGVANLRQQASQSYTDTMARFGKNPVPLDISVVRQRIAGMKPESYDTWSDSKGPRPAEHRAWETMNEFVDEYAYKASQDPSLLTPLAVDQFKQDLYDVGSKIGGAYDRDAARIAGTAYASVKDVLVKHDPIYADAMKNYENAAKEAQQLETTFSLAAARGKQPNIESAGRKLTSIFRNNVNTNYGSRTAQAERLADVDPSGTMFPALAGQSLGSYMPRGIQGAVARAGVGTGITGMALDAVPMALDIPGYLSGYNLAALPASSPRLIGEAAYYGGRGAGAVSELTKPLTSRVGNAADWLVQKQEQYRNPLMAAGVAGMNLGAMKDPELQGLLEQYAGQPPAPEPEPEPEVVIDKETGRSMAFNPETQRWFYTDTGEDAEGIPGFREGGRVHDNRAALFARYR